MVARDKRSSLFTFGLYYKEILVVNDNSSIIIKLQCHLMTTLESSYTFVLRL